MSGFSIKAPLLSPTGFPRMLHLAVSRGGTTGPDDGAISAGPADTAFATPAAAYTDRGPVPQPTHARAGVFAGAVAATSQPYIDVTKAESLAVFSARYAAIRTLGHGGEGHAVLVQDRGTGELAVAKYAIVPQDEDRLGREALALPRMNHPHVVHFRGLYAGPHPELPGQVTLRTVTDFVPGDSLADVLSKPAAERSVTVNEATLWSIFDQLRDAVTALELAGVVHGDLHPGNMIVTSLDSGRAHVTLIDFGVSKVMRHQTLIHVTRHQPAHTAFFAAPELYSPHADSTFRFVRGTDRYSIGTTLLAVMVGGEIPVRTTPQELLAELRSEPNTPWSTELFDAIAGLLQEQPAARQWPVRTAHTHVVASTEAKAVVAERNRLADDLRIAQGELARLGALLAAHGITALAPEDIVSSSKALQHLGHTGHDALVSAYDKKMKEYGNVALGSLFMALGEWGVTYGSTTHSGLLAILAGVTTVFGLGAAFSWRNWRDEREKIAEWRAAEHYFGSVFYNGANLKRYGCLKVSTTDLMDIAHGDFVHPIETKSEIVRYKRETHLSDWFVNGLSISTVTKIEKYPSNNSLWSKTMHQFRFVGRLPKDSEPSFFAFSSPSLKKVEAVRATLLHAIEAGTPLMLHARDYDLDEDRNDAIIIHDIPLLRPALTKADLASAGD